MWPHTAEDKSFLAKWSISFAEAIDVLCTYPAERNLLEDMHVKRKQDFRENLNYLLSLDIAEGPELRKVLVENKFMKGKVHKEIDRYGILYRWCK